jgi:hypothetical protein
VGKVIAVVMVSRLDILMAVEAEVQGPLVPLVVLPELTVVLD